MVSTSPTTRSIDPHLLTADVSQHSLARFLTIPEVAEQLSLSRTKVYSLIKQEGLPVVRFGRAVRISQDDLSVWLANRKSSGNRCGAWKGQDGSKGVL
jgi:excisionase family DNA binding protein